MRNCRFVRTKRSREQNAALEDTAVILYERPCYTKRSAELLPLSSSSSHKGSIELNCSAPVNVASLLKRGHVQASSF